MTQVDGGVLKRTGPITRGPRRRLPGHHVSIPKGPERTVRRGRRGLLSHRTDLTLGLDPSGRPEFQETFLSTKSGERSGDGVRSGKGVVLVYDEEFGGGTTAERDEILEVTEG